MPEDTGEKDSGSNSPVIRVPKNFILPEQVKDLAERQTEGGRLDLTKMEKGSNIKVDFYPDNNTFEDCPSLYIQTLTPATKGGVFYEAIAAGGPAEWDLNNTKIRIVGSKFSPFQFAIMVDFITPTMFLEIRAFDPDKAKEQRAGKKKISTTFGKKYLEDESLKEILKVDPTFLDNFIGWETLYSPKVASFEVEKLQQKKV